MSEGADVRRSARALYVVTSAQDRPVARPDRSPAGKARRTASTPATGHSCCRHQRLWIDGRVHARFLDAAGKRGVYTSRIWCAFTSASGWRVSWFPKQTSCRPLRIAKKPTLALQSRCSRSRPPPPSSFLKTIPPITCLLEVGLGGRFDATNVIDRAAASVITPVSYDHPEFLGTELAGIAGEKAGIIKRDTPVISGWQASVALDVIGSRRNGFVRPSSSAGRTSIATSSMAASSTRTSADCWTCRGRACRDSTSLKTRPPQLRRCEQSSPISPPPFMKRAWERSIGRAPAAAEPWARSSQ